MPHNPCSRPCPSFSDPPSPFSGADAWWIRGISLKRRVGKIPNQLELCKVLDAQTSRREFTQAGNRVRVPCTATNYYHDKHDVRRRIRSAVHRHHYWTECRTRINLMEIDGNGVRRGTDFKPQGGRKEGKASNLQRGSGIACIQSCIGQ